MLEKVQEKVSVLSIYNSNDGSVMPSKIRWRGRQYTIAKLGYYHKRKVGKDLLHVFDTTDGTMAFRLVCDPLTLHWTLEEVSDGQHT